MKLPNQARFQRPASVNTSPRPTAIADARSTRLFTGGGEARKGNAAKRTKKIAE